MAASRSGFPSELCAGVEQDFVCSSRLQSTQYRLDAPAFLSQTQLSSFIPSSASSTKLSGLADVFTVYIQSPVLAHVAPFKNSRPYMTTSELGEYQSGRLTHVSLTADPRLLGWEIKRGNIVISRSGRVGESYWVDKKLNGALVGDSFRVVPHDRDDACFLFAVLSSNFARDFLSGSAYGSVVDHASLDQLRNFPLPKVSPSVRARISEKIKEVVSLRERAYDLLDNTQEAILRTNALPRLEGSTLAGGAFHSVQVKCSEVVRQVGGSSEFRLEAHFHNPVARTAIANIQKCPSAKKTVGQLSHDVIMGGRFKRNYVESDYGTPFLSGKNIVQIRPTDLKHLSNSQTDGLDELLIKRGWILVTCSGTIGRTCFVWHNFEDYAASQHILRVLPDSQQVDPGYLYASFPPPTVTSKSSVFATAPSSTKSPTAS